MKCPKCGSESESRFCPECGEKVRGGVDPQGEVSETVAEQEAPDKKEDLTTLNNTETKEAKSNFFSDFIHKLQSLSSTSKKIGVGLLLGIIVLILFIVGVTNPVQSGVPQASTSDEYTKTFYGTNREYLEGLPIYTSGYVTYSEKKAYQDSPVAVLKIDSDTEGYVAWIGRGKNFLADDVEIDKATIKEMAEEISEVYKGVGNIKKITSGFSNSYKFKTDHYKGYIIAEPTSSGLFIGVSTQKVDDNNDYKFADVMKHIPISDWNVLNKEATVVSDLKASYSGSTEEGAEISPTTKSLIVSAKINGLEKTLYPAMFTMENAGKLVAGQKSVFPIHVKDQTFNLEIQCTTETAEQRAAREQAEREKQIAEENARKEAKLNENALRSARSYLNYTHFSRQGLIEQLEFEGYTEAQSVYAADNVGADWNQQAIGAAKDYLEHMSFSHSGLVEQLIFEGFTPEQAEFGVSGAGL